MNATFPTGRDGTSAVWDGSNAYVFGGSNTDGNLNQIVRYTPLGSARPASSRLRKKHETRPGVLQLL